MLKRVAKCDKIRVNNDLKMTERFIYDTRTRVQRPHSQPECAL